VGIQLAEGALSATVDRISGASEPSDVATGAVVSHRNTRLGASSD